MKSRHSSITELELHIPGLRRFARGLLRGDHERADDLVQDSLERALSHWHKRRSDGNLRGWLYTILFHRFVTDRQSRLRRQVSLSSLTASLEKDTSIVDGHQDGVLKCRDLLRGFAVLTEEQRAVLLLVAIDGFSYEEAARILGVPIGTIMSRLSRGRERLRAYMDGGSGLRRTAGAGRKDNAAANPVQQIPFANGRVVQTRLAPAYAGADAPCPDLIRAPASYF